MLFIRWWWVFNKCIHIYILTYVTYIMYKKNQTMKIRHTYNNPIHINEFLFLWHSVTRKYARFFIFPYRVYIIERAHSWCFGRQKFYIFKKIYRMCRRDIYLRKDFSYESTYSRLFLGIQKKIDIQRVK